MIGVPKLQVRYRSTLFHHPSLSLSLESTETRARLNGFKFVRPSRCWPADSVLIELLRIRSPQAVHLDRIGQNGASLYCQPEWYVPVRTGTTKYENFTVVPVFRDHFSLRFTSPPIYGNEYGGIQIKYKPHSEVKFPPKFDFCYSIIALRGRTTSVLKSKRCC